MRAELTHDAAEPASFPNDDLPEVAVLGRSNVGKSTFINQLVGRKQLARTSQTPGKTRRIQFYRLDDRAYLVDLPGYGYAAVGHDERAGWRPLIESYLRGERQTLRGALLLVDLRRGLEDEELSLLEWLDSERIPWKLVFTKSDKLGSREISSKLGELLDGIALDRNDIATVSGKTGRGLADVGAWLLTWMNVKFLRPDGTPLLG